MHLPLPSQDRMPVTPSPSQVPALHSVSFTYRRQPPLPSQVPSCPQVAGVLAGQTRGSWGFTPDGTKAQTPRELGRLQALHLSPQAEVQQTPSTQYPLWHSPSQLQDSACPLDLLTVPGAQTPGCWAASDVLASFFPPSDLPPASSRKLAVVQPAAPKTAHRARAAPKAVPTAYDDFDP